MLCSSLIHESRSVPPLYNLVVTDFDPSPRTNTRRTKCPPSTVVINIRNTPGHPWSSGWTLCIRSVLWPLVHGPSGISGAVPTDEADTSAGCSLVAMIAEDDADSADEREGMGLWKCKRRSLRGERLRPPNPYLVIPTKNENPQPRLVRRTSKTIKRNPTSPEAPCTWTSIFLCFYTAHRRKQEIPLAGPPACEKVPRTLVWRFA